MLTGFDAFFQLQRLIIDELVTALRGTVGGAITNACVVPGEIAWDECDCGQLTISQSRLFLSDDPPTPTTVVSPCQAAYLVADLVIVVLRCAPSPQGNATFPTCAALEASARVVAEDARVTLETVTCLLLGLEDTNVIAGYLVNEATVRGPAGGCVGVELRLTAWLLRGIS